MNVQKGDIIYCEFPSFGDKLGRPAIVLDKTDYGFVCLRITHTKSTDVYSLPTDLSGIIDCCSAITGFIYLKQTTILKEQCFISNCSMCKISTGLKLILLRYGIKF